MSGLRRLRRAAYASIGTAFTFMIACNEDYYDSIGSFGGSSGTSSSGGFDSGAQGASFCDTVEEDAACYSPSSDACERGSSANYACNAHLRCDGQNWNYEAAERASCRTDCPAAYTETFAGCGVGSAAGTLLCEYDEGTCGCAPIYEPKVDAGPRDAGAVGDAGDAGDAGAVGDGGDAGTITDAGSSPDAGKRPKSTPIGYEWRCVKPQSSIADAGATGCPRLRPREGQECVRPMTCDYGSCVFEDGYRMGCYGGSWVRDLSRSTQCD